jgi:hypothetical protein
MASCSAVRPHRERRFEAVVGQSDGEEAASELPPTGRHLAAFALPIRPPMSRAETLFVSRARAGRPQ